MLLLGGLVGRWGRGGVVPLCWGSLLRWLCSSRGLASVSCGALLILLCSACRIPGIDRREAVAQPTPTLVSQFALATRELPLEGRLEGTPTVSVHLQGADLRAVSFSTGQPTVSSWFGGASGASLSGVTEVGDRVTVTPSFAERTPLPTPTWRSMPTPRPTSAQEPAPVQPSDTPYEEELLPFTFSDIYTDVLAIGWAVSQSWGVSVDMGHTAHVHGGASAIAVSPHEDYGAVFFAVLPDSPRVYPYDRVLGLRFWLGAGDEPIYTDQLAVTVVGSNAYTYWREDDTSVEIDEGESFFSETRLYYLNLNRALPAGSWSEVILWLDRLPFDPD